MNRENYVDLALSVPWFAKYVKEHPEIKIEVRFVQDRSMSTTAQNELLDDIARIGRHIWQIRLNLF